MLIDTHCHLNYNDQEKTLIALATSEVKIVVVSGCDVSSCIAAIKLAHQYPFVYATVGFHPEYCNSIDESDYSLFDRWLEDKKVVAVGEIGLDYHYDGSERIKQLELFERQLNIAAKHNKPVVVHSRDASNDTYNTLSKYKLKGIIHCFIDTLEFANKYINLGYLLGIGGIITFKNSNLKDVINGISLDNIVLETDSPYLAPEPQRGKQNSPLNLPIIAQTIAVIKKTTYADIATATTKNAMQLFDFMGD